MLHSGGLWAMEPTWHDSLKAKLGRLTPQDITILARAGVKHTQRSPSLTASGVAVIPILGSMLPSVPWYYAAYGLTATSTTQATGAVKDAASDEKVKGIFLYIDSPGGRVDGTEQLAEAVWQAGTQKKVVASVNNMCCSGAYWVASQCSLVTANPAATIGSIGCLLAHEDWSRRYANEGIEVRLFTSGPAKGAGYHNGVPLSEAGVKEMQSIVDDYGRMFTDSVSRGRQRDASGWATGGTWRASTAMNMGLIDKLAYADRALQLFIESVK